MWIFANVIWFSFNFQLLRLFRALKVISMFFYLWIRLNFRLYLFYRCHPMFHWKRNSHSVFQSHNVVLKAHLKRFFRHWTGLFRFFSDTKRKYSTFFPPEFFILYSVIYDWICQNSLFFGKNIFIPKGLLTFFYCLFLMSADFISSMLKTISDFLQAIPNAIPWTIPCIPWEVTDSSGNTRNTLTEFIVIIRQSRN